MPKCKQTRHILFFLKTGFIVSHFIFIRIKKNERFRTDDTLENYISCISHYFIQTNIGQHFFFNSRYTKPSSKKKQQKTNLSFEREKKSNKLRFLNFIFWWQILDRTMIMNVLLIEMKRHQSCFRHKIWIITIQSIHSTFTINI